MHVARLITVVLLILAILIAYSPLVRETVAETWEAFRPAVVAIMDDCYAAIRNLIVGNGSNDQIVTMKNGIV